MIDLRIDQHKLDDLLREINGTDEQVSNAMRSTVAKMSTWLRSRAARSLSAELQVKQKVMRFRLKNIKLKKAPNGAAGGVWLGLNDLDFVHLGGASQDNRGVVYRGREFSKAFLGPRPGAVAGKLAGRAFKRQGTARLPIEKVGLPIQEEANKALESEVMEWGRFEAQFFKVLERELRWRTR
jgi:hypothetical protein